MKDCPWQPKHQQKFEQANEYSNSAIWGTTIVAGSYGVVLVDLSDTSGFPHDSTTSLHVEQIAIGGLAGTTLNAEIYIGYMTTTCPGTQVTGVLSVFDKIKLVKTGGPALLTADGELVRDYGNGIKTVSTSLLIGDGLPLTGSHFPNDRDLPCPCADGSTRVGTGDLCAYIKHTGGSFTDLIFRVSYHSH